MTNRVKRLVHYDPSYPVEINIGIGAYIKPIDHDSGIVSNEKMCVTSPVVSYEGNGCFETLNTLYVPAQ